MFFVFIISSRYNLNTGLIIFVHFADHNCFVTMSLAICDVCKFFPPAGKICSNPFWWQMIKKSSHVTSQSVDWNSLCGPQIELSISVMQVFRQLPEFRQSRTSDKIFRQFDYLWPSLPQFSFLRKIDEIPPSMTKLKTWRPLFYCILLQFFSCLHMLLKGFESQIGPYVFSQKKFANLKLALRTFSGNLVTCHLHHWCIRPVKSNEIGRPDQAKWGGVRYCDPWFTLSDARF